MKRYKCSEMAVKKEVSTFNFVYVCSNEGVYKPITIGFTPDARIVTVIRRLDDTKNTLFIDKNIVEPVSTLNWKNVEFIQVDEVMCVDFMEAPNVK